MRIETAKCRSSRRRLATGFSLIELMVVMAILGVLAVLAGPSFVDAIKRYKINSISNELTSSMQLARVESIRRHVPVLLSRRTGCSNTLIDINDWSCGWEIVVDTNSNSAKNANEPVLQVTEVPTGFGVMHTGLGAVMTFNVWGQAGVGQKFVITPSEGLSGTTTTTLCMNSGGRIKKLPGEVACP